MAQVERVARARVARARVIDVVTRLVRQEAVVTGVVDALVAQRGTTLVALRRMVVDHVEDHLEAGGVKLVDGLLNFVREPVAM